MYLCRVWEKLEFILLKSRFEISLSITVYTNRISYEILNTCPSSSRQVVNSSIRQPNWNDSPIIPFPLISIITLFNHSIKLAHVIINLN